MHIVFISSLFYFSIPLLGFIYFILYKYNSQESCFGNIFLLLEEMRIRDTVYIISCRYLYITQYYLSFDAAIGCTERRFTMMKQC